MVFSIILQASEHVSKTTNQRIYEAVASDTARQTDQLKLQKKRAVVTMKTRVSISTNRNDLPFVYKVST